MDKIVINPEKIRGLGNILNSKSPQDFTCEECEVSSSENDDFLMRYVFLPVNLELTGTTSSVYIGDSVSLEAKPLTNYGMSKSGLSIDFYDGNTKISTESTDNNGVAHLMGYTISSVGDHIFSARLGELTSNNYKIVGKYYAKLDITLPSAIYKNQSFNVQGRLYNLNNTSEGLSNIPLKIILVDSNHNQVPYYITTDSNGNFEKEVVFTDTGSGSITCQIDPQSNIDYIFCMTAYKTVNVTVPPTTYNLDSYLTDTQNYVYAQGTVSKLSVNNSDNSINFASTVMAINNNVFCSIDKYTLEFDWKLSKGYEGGFMLGTPTNYLSFTQQSSNFPVQHGNMTSEGYYGENQGNSSSNRFSSYVHVIITRNGNEFTVDVNNGTIHIVYTPNYGDPIENKFGGRCWNGTCSIKNLKVTY